MASTIPFALKDIANFSLGDEVVVALEPVVAVLPHECRVVTGF